MFSEALARTARDKHGLAVRLDTRVTALRAEHDRIAGVETSAGVLTADSYVLALGVGAPLVARTAGVSLPIYPAKGYSSTFPLKPGGRAVLLVSESASLERAARAAGWKPQRHATLRVLGQLATISVWRKPEESATKD